ncbi:MAG: hypothetical protein H0X04_02675 [Chthoniobacterales bacterium]|nr:hypothetical protein [Chthoniobacterales bacterium]
MRLSPFDFVDTPIFPLKPDERAMIYGILLRYPDAMRKQWKAKWGPFRPSFRVRSFVENIIGESPLVEDEAA